MNKTFKWILIGAAILITGFIVKSHSGFAVGIKYGCHFMPLFIRFDKQ